MIYGYARVSTKEQNEARQMAALMEAGVEEVDIYLDKQSGKNFDRPYWHDLCEILEPGDLLYVKSIDRLGRDYAEIQEQWRILTKEKGVDIVVLDMPLLDTRKGKDLLGTFVSDIVLQVLAFVAENERGNIRQRQTEGIAAAKARGVKFGRKAKECPPQFEKTFELWRSGGCSTQKAAEMLGMPYSTAKYKLQKRMEETA